MLYLQSTWFVCAFFCVKLLRVASSIQVFVHCGVFCDRQGQELHMTDAKLIVAQHLYEFCDCASYILSMALVFHIYWRR